MAEDTGSFGVCPLPLRSTDQVLLAHGGGGKLTADLIARVFRSQFANPLLNAEHDGAVFAVPSARLAFTSDAYVVDPIFFPGGDIGSLAINGTVNDLAMCGARAQFLSACFILQEGVPLADLERIVASMQRTAVAVGAQVVTADTKVVERGSGLPGLHIAMSGIGSIEHAQEIGPGSVQPGDVVLLSGDIGRHGIAVMSARHELNFEGLLPSDCASLYEPVAALLEAGVDVHCLRDLTRGGLAAAVVEIARKARVAIELDERRIPVAEPVRGACELLGLDPLHVACEGRFIAIVPGGLADKATAILRESSIAAEACCIGKVTAGPAGETTRITAIGSRRVLDLPTGEQLPRIC